MPKAVRFNEYGGVDELQVVDVDRPMPGPGQVVVRVRAAGINPGEAKIREGAMATVSPATFPSGEGTDLAGVVDELGPDVSTVQVGDEVIGFTDRASQAELAVVNAENLTPKPEGVSWEVAGALSVVGTTAWAAVRAVNPQPGDVIAVSGAAGGVGSIAVQLLKRAGVVVIGIAGPDNHDWLRSVGVIPVDYGDGLADRIREATNGKIDAFIDTYGVGYVDLALELGVMPDRIETIADFVRGPAVGAKMDGNSVGAHAEVVAELAGLIDAGELEVPIADVYPLEEVQAAYRELSEGHIRGKIVLVP